MAIRSYEDLLAWQKGMDLVEEVYRLSSGFPRDERIGLTNQIRRAAMSIPSNIAEGHGRIYKAEFLRQLSIARGSLMEVETQLKAALRLGFLEAAKTARVFELCAEVGRLLNGLIRSLDEGGANGRIFEESVLYQSDP
jgi:four helix bundle protein